MQRNFVSYPKSGRTWLRYIFVELGIEREMQFHHDGFEFNDGSKPAHDFDLSARLKRYGEVEKLVYLERDPRDVMVSLYYQITGRFRELFHYPGTISDFIRDDYFGARNLRRFRELWSELTQQLGFLCITYEQCHVDMTQTISQVLDYLELPCDDARIASALERASFRNMRQLEQSNSFPEAWLRLRNNSPKVRRGEIGSYREVLNEENIRFLNRMFLFVDQTARVRA